MQNVRRLCDDAPALLLLAVEHPHRVGLEAAQAGLTELTGARLEKLTQHGAKGPTALGVAHAVDAHPHVSDAEAQAEMEEQVQHFGVGRR